MWAHKTRLLALSIVAILSLQAASAAAQESRDPAIVTTAAAPSTPASGVIEHELRRESDLRVRSFTTNHTGPEYVAPTRFNRVVDYGSDD